ncbi:MAG: transposase [Nitrospinae bacterium]|nr:transposase [Nitrospinota bacterium]
MQKISWMNALSSGGLYRARQNAVGLGPIYMARLTYDRENQVVFYRTDKETLSFDPVEFLARLSVHVPNAREQTARYMGYYSNKSRERIGVKTLNCE